MEFYFHPFGPQRISFGLFENYIDYVFVQSDRFPLQIGQSFRIINTNYPNSLKRKRNQISKAWKSFYFGVTEAGEQMFILVKMGKMDSGCVPKSNYHSSSCQIPVYLECRDKILTYLKKEDLKAESEEGENEEMDSEDIFSDDGQEGENIFSDEEQEGENIFSNEEPEGEEDGVQEESQERDDEDEISVVDERNEGEMRENIIGNEEVELVPDRKSKKYDDMVDKKYPMLSKLGS
jgi:hypothetical protein